METECCFKTNEKLVYISTCKRVDMHKQGDSFCNITYFTGWL